MATSSARSASDKDLLAVAIGRAVQMRRRELGLDPAQIVKQVSLSPSYFRAIEAGSVAPPPGIAIPLALVLDWDARAVCEAFCALAYLSGDNPNERAKLLFSHGVAASIMNHLDNEEALLGAVANSFMAREPAVDNGQAATPVNTPTSSNLPWMFDIAINRMISEVSAAQFTIDKTFSTDFVRKNSKSIRNVRALLSYVPNGTMYKNSGYDFSFLANANATFWIKFVGNRDLVKNVKPDMVTALAEMVAVSDRRLSTSDLKAELEDRLIMDVHEGGFDLVFDPVSRTLEVNDKPGRYRQSYCNAWLYELSQAGEWYWVGFIDSFSGFSADESLEIVPLSLLQVARLNDTFFSK
jgi:hypothetical protein